MTNKDMSFEDVVTLYISCDYVLEYKLRISTDSFRNIPIKEARYKVLKLINRLYGFMLPYSQVRRLDRKQLHDFLAIFVKEYFSRLPIQIATPMETLVTDHTDVRIRQIRWDINLRTGYTRSGVVTYYGLYCPDNYKLCKVSVDTKEQVFPIHEWHNEHPEYVVALKQLNPLEMVERPDQAPVGKYRWCVYGIILGLILAWVLYHLFF